MMVLWLFVHESGKRQKIDGRVKKTYLGHGLLGLVASRSPCQPSTGSASSNLRLETGGVAYGIPVKLK